MKHITPKAIQELALIIIVIFYTIIELKNNNKSNKR